MRNILNKWIRGLAACLLILFVSGTTAFFVFPLPGQVPILMYHFLGSPEDAASSGNYVTVRTFENQMRFLKIFGYRVITMEQFDEIRSGKRKPRGRELVLTFDDGNPSVFSQAWPILKKYSFPSTQFLISEIFENAIYGDEALSELRKVGTEPLLRWGAHSRTHPFLSELATAGVESEVSGSKVDLEKELGVPIHYFAYPFGDFDSRSMEAVQKAGYRLAFTTSPKKLNAFQSGDYCIPRVKITESAANPFIFWIKVSGIYDSYKLWRHHLYQKKQARTATR